MLDQEQPEIQQENNDSRTFINIRKLAALDIVFHGPLLILGEFAIAVLVCGCFGILSLLAFFRTPDRPLLTLLIGLLLSWIGLNYLPLLLYAISIVRQKSAQQEVGFELQHKDIYARKYTLQSVVLLILPLIIPILALVQEIQRKNRSGVISLK